MKLSIKLNRNFVYFFFFLLFSWFDFITFLSISEDWRAVVPTAYFMFKNFIVSIIRRTSPYLYHILIFVSNPGFRLISCPSSHFLVLISDTSLLLTCFSSSYILLFVFHPYLHRTFPVDLSQISPKPLFLSSHSSV